MANKKKKKEKKQKKKKVKVISKKKISKIKAKKKLWFKILSPKIFGNREIGESYLPLAEKAIGRVMKISLKELTSNVKDQNVYITLQINKVSGTTLNTSVIGYQLTPAYVKRIVKKRIAKLDDYFQSKTNGGKEIILKPLIITLNQTKRSTKTQLRKELQKLLMEELSKSSFEQFVTNLVTRRIQMGIKKKLNKIFPVKEATIRVLKQKTKGLAKEEVIIEDKIKEKKEKTEKEEKAKE